MVFLICIFLMTNFIESLFMCHIFIFILMCVLKYFFSLIKWAVCILSFKSSLYILICLLWDMCFKYLIQSVTQFFILLMVSFEDQKILVLMMSNLLKIFIVSALHVSSIFAYLKIVKNVYVLFQEINDFSFYI